MKTDVARKAATLEQQDNAKNTRRTLKVLQQSVDDKENLAGRAPLIKDITQKALSNPKKLKLMHKATQTDTITTEDLTGEEPSQDYWKKLAEKRGDALNDSLQENERLKECVENLQEENKVCKEMLEESKHLVEVLQEMLGEEGDISVAEEATENK